MPNEKSHPKLSLSKADSLPPNVHLFHNDLQANRLLRHPFESFLSDVSYNKHNGGKLRIHRSNSQSFTGKLSLKNQVPKINLPDSPKPNKSTKDNKDLRLKESTLKPILKRGHTIATVESPKFRLSSKSFHQGLIKRIPSIKRSRSKSVDEKNQIKIDPHRTTVIRNLNTHCDDNQSRGRERTKQKPTGIKVKRHNSAVTNVAKIITVKRNNSLSRLSLNLKNSLSNIQNAVPKINVPNALKKKDSVKASKAEFDPTHQTNHKEYQKTKLCKMNPNFSTHVGYQNITNTSKAHLKSAFKRGNLGVSSLDQNEENKFLKIKKSSNNQRSPSPSLPIKSNLRNVKNIDKHVLSVRRSYQTGEKINRYQCNLELKFSKNLDRKNSERRIKIDTTRNMQGKSSEKKILKASLSSGNQPLSSMHSNFHINHYSDLLPPQISKIPSSRGNLNYQDYEESCAITVRSSMSHQTNGLAISTCNSIGTFTPHDISPQGDVESRVITPIRSDRNREQLKLSLPSPVRNKCISLFPQLQLNSKENPIDPNKEMSNFTEETERKVLELGRAISYNPRFLKNQGQNQQKQTQELDFHLDNKSCINRRNFKKICQSRDLISEYDNTSGTRISKDTENFNILDLDSVNVSQFKSPCVSKRANKSNRDQTDPETKIVQNDLKSQMENLTMKLTNSTESFSEIKDWINPNGPKEKEKLKITQSLSHHLTRARNSISKVGNRLDGINVRPLSIRKRSSSNTYSDFTKSKEKIGPLVPFPIEKKVIFKKKLSGALSLPQ